MDFMGDPAPALLDGLRKQPTVPVGFIDLPELSEFRRFPSGDAPPDRPDARDVPIPR
jgi:hypothetical protein